jgi:Pvc16 N-terminal domain
MIFQAIDTIRAELIAGGVPAELGNIGEILAGSAHGDDTNIVISLINIEENRISRDPQNYARSGLDIKHKNPAVHLYLTLLFTSVRHEGGYGKALEIVQNTIAFFQKKFVFDHSNVPSLDSGIEKLILEMISLNLEQLHQLWSMLGGKYHPSVAYRMRMVTIDSATDIDGRLIKEIQIIV